VFILRFNDIKNLNLMLGENFLENSIKKVSFQVNQDEIIIALKKNDHLAVLLDSFLV